jgi:ParB-like chromosome segregation protein Spo0J
VINIEYVDADKLQPAQYNPRTMTDDAMGRLVKLLDAHGIVDPLIARRSDNMLIGGHQRLKANSLRANPDTQVPVVYVDVNDEEAKALNIALNNTKAMGEYDNSILADLLQELDNGEIDVEAATGFAEKDIAELMHGLDEHANWDEAMDGVPDGDGSGFQQMTFTLTDAQVDVVKRATDKAKGCGFGDTGNENSNGNALALVAEAYCGSS